MTKTLKDAYKKVIDDLVSDVHQKEQRLHRMRVCLEVLKEQSAATKATNEKGKP